MKPDISNKGEKINAKDNEAIISVHELRKTFMGGNEVLKGVNLELMKGENLTILGRSGSGKSVVIKCLVGLIKPDDGAINIFGTDVLHLSEDRLNSIRLKMGFLFQNSALYDSMTVGQNLEFPLKRCQKDMKKDEIKDRVMEVLTNVGLPETVNKMPAELSGGMRKRIGLARTLILQPSIMLYDEPTTGLDTITSREISNLMLSMQEKYKTSSIIITHDLNCAKLTSQRVLILNDGVIGAEGSYAALENSQESWIREFFS